MTRLKRWIPNSNWLQERREDVLAIASMVLFFVAFFPQGLFGGKYLILADAFFYSYPMRTIAWQMVRDGQLPLWTPSIMSGYPLLSMAQLGLGYPLTWGYLFLPGHVAEQIYILAPFLLAPIFTYLYLRELKLSPLAALLGALTFGYGGMMASPLASNGLFPNAVMWLPLLLIALERARSNPLIPCFLAATGAFSMSVLTGVGQGFVYAGIIGFAYAVFIGFGSARDSETARSRVPLRWRPMVVMTVAALFTFGIASFQILETGRVVRRSIRSVVDYESFTQGSMTPIYLWNSFIVPLFHVIDMHAAVPPVAVGLAVVAVIAHLRKPESDRRVIFWLAVAVLACILMLGSSTPLYRIVHHIPIVNQFRVPSRHTFEWTFAVSVLAAYGWDAVANWLRLKQPTARRPALLPIVSVVLLAASIVIGILWWRRVGTLPLFPGMGSPSAATIYLLWKTAFVLTTLVTLWRASLIIEQRLRFGMVLLTMLVLCFVEPSALLTRWWGHGVYSSRFHTVSDAAKFLKQYPPEQARVYTRVDLMSEQYGSPPRFDSPNFSAISGVQNVAGYEPLVLERYSRALGGVGLDTVLSPKTGLPDDSLLRSESHVLDILNTTFIISYRDLDTDLNTLNNQNRLAQSAVPGVVVPQTTKTLATSPISVADSLDFVTSLSNSTEEPDDALIARVQIFTAKGNIIEHELLAGRDSSDWAHDRPDVRPFIKHRLAPIFDQVMVGEENGYPAYRYKTSVRFAEPTEVVRVKVSNLSTTARLSIYSAQLTDSKSQKSVPLHSLASHFFEPAYEHNSMLILRNTRAQPRAWLTPEAETVDGEEALKRIRGESSTPFDPQHTALMEIDSHELPDLPGGVVSRDAARITHYGPNSLTVETNASIPTVLVLSEIFYPGWEAIIDGNKTRIYLTNFLLRGVVVPAGQHKIEMSYTAPAARNGAVISGITLLGMIGLALKHRRQRRLMKQTATV